MPQIIIIIITVGCDTSLSLIIFYITQAVAAYSICVYHTYTQKIMLQPIVYIKSTALLEMSNLKIQKFSGLPHKKLQFL